ncbi:ATP-binding cassette domain-containing protein [Brucella sp. NBRC 113783]|uniref:ATP-binding cassette domain-containing protein n=1 Tax=Brucella sp. NBRC 113783 TaxID=3075478 RepID=UPI0029BFF889|nr:ATP-binding cassette domain-containing protein [Brucella sp. NBRC 113783]MDX4075591.1 ATP-binding cassette domain-containing protein [Brucella sp. NBRC 113783]
MSQTPLNNSTPALELRGITKRFGGIVALENVSISVRPGEVLALVGDNGAGKSTLIKTIAGINIPDTGEIWVEGKVAKISGPQDSMGYGIQTVYQDLALCDNLDTVQNLFLGRELHGGLLSGRRLRRADMENHAKKVLSELGVRTLRDLSAPVGSLSGGQRQSVAICRSVLWEPKVVLLDEPTAALGVAQRKEVMSLILRLRATNHAVIVISHDLADVQEMADKVTVLRLGRKVTEFSKGSFSRDDLVSAITGLTASAA